MRITGKLYDVWRARGPLWKRQTEASAAGCVAYAEQHMNSHTNPDINYALAIVDANASGASKSWARSYTANCSRMFGHADRGVIIGPPRGSYNVRFLKCPAILLEPGFVSNKAFVESALTGEGLEGLARCLVDSIREHFPEGGLIGLSVGHMYRDKPDPGAPVNQGEMVDPAFDTEAEINEQILTIAEEMLLAVERSDTEPAPPPESERGAA